MFAPRAPAPGPRPLLVFLHGVGERGDSLDTLDRLRVHSLPALAGADALPAVSGGPFPFLIACPQIAGRWEEAVDAVATVIDVVVGEHGGDPRRVYVTGISLGAVGCWEIAARVPGVAAIAPLSGAVPGTAASVSVPAWIEVGERDPFVNADGVRRAVAGRAGDRTVLRVDPHGGHDGGYWDHVYGRAEPYRWLLGWSSVTSGA